MRTGARGKGVWVVAAGTAAAAALAGCGGSGAALLGKSTTTARAASTTVGSSSGSSSAAGIGTSTTVAQPPTSQPQGTTQGQGAQGQGSQGQGSQSQGTAAPTTVPPTTVPPTTVPPTTVPPTTVPAVPTVDTMPLTGSYSPAVKPATIYLSGDSGNIVTGLRWAGWDSHGATGYGTVDIQGCVPDCAQGSETPTPVTIYLNNPVHGAFSLLTEDIKGHPAQNFTLPTG